MTAVAKCILLAAVMPVVAAAQGLGCQGAENQLAAAESALENGDAAGAERAYSAVQTAHPDCAEALLGVGRALAAGRNFGAAYQLLARYSQLAPRDPRGYVAAGEMLLDAGRPAQAEALSAQAVALDPKNVEALVLRGRILGMKGEVSQAEQMLNTACRLAPRKPQPHFELGVLYDRLQRNGKAVEQFEAVTRLNPRDARAYDYLALNLEPLGQFARADRAYQQGLKVNRPPLFDAFLDYNYGRFLMKLNRLEEAGRHLDRALQVAPDTRAIHYERAKLNEKLGKYEQARVESERALALKDPGGVILDLQVYYQLARIYTRLGNKEMAAKFAKLTEGSSVPLRSRMRGGR